MDEGQLNIRCIAITTKFKDTLKDVVLKTELTYYYLFQRTLRVKCHYSMRMKVHSGRRNQISSEFLDLGEKWTKEIV